MTTMTVMPHAHDDWTVDDLDQLPDDGLRYELLDGLLLVSPAPTPRHQTAVREIFKVLDAHLPDDLDLFFAPLEWRPDRFTSLQPDVLVVDKKAVGEKHISDPLTLAVEVLSPSTRRKDQLLKFSKYAEAGIPSYWIIDPDEPSIVVFELRNGGYVEETRAVGPVNAVIQRPFLVTLTPRDLIAK